MKLPSTFAHARAGLAALGVLTGSWLGGGTDSAGYPEREANAWPLWVARDDAAGAYQETTGAGPLIFRRETAESITSGVRPFWIQQQDADGRFQVGHFLYPLFTYRQDAETYEWSLLKFIRQTERRAGVPAPTSEFEPARRVEVWPFWFSKDAVNPAEDYRALFPVAGTIKHKLGFDRATFFAFPLYMQTEKRGIVTTSTPWPIVRRTSGAAHGFGLWPLFETKEKDGVWRQESYLWPFGYNNTFQLPPEAPQGAGVRREIGVLPFYARHTAPGYRDENFLWPFFGYTDRTKPTVYHETRYFWPFLVQGRGEKHVNRWAPFYTHSISKGYDKTWYAWPVWRRGQWQEREVNVTRSQLLFFLYWSEVQRSVRTPTKPAASLTHVWPLFSHFDNGAGRRQLQLFSPFEVFFPGNEKVRAAWSPLVAIARHEQTAPGETRTSFLWNAVTHRRSAARGEREFHVGPLFSASRTHAGERIAFGRGLVAFRRSAGAGWQVRWFDFASRSAADKPQSRRDAGAPRTDLSPPR